MIKSRSVSKDQYIGTYYDFGLGFVDVHNTTEYSETASVDTTNHHAWLMQDDASGYFKKQANLTRRTPSQRAVITNGINLYYDGSLTAGVANWAFPALVGDGNQWGAIAYDRMKPTKPMYSLFNMVYELRELPSMIWRADEMFRATLSTWGQNYLSQVFGWTPLINDIFTLIEKQKTIEKRVDWLLRNQGKWIRREVKLFENRSVLWENDWTYQYNAFEQFFTTQFYHGVPRFKQRQELVDRVWASAEFRYFLPPAPPGVKHSKMLTRALQGFHGIRMHQLYRAIPWTWLVDWCLGAARVLENLDAGVADLLAARRFVIMREQKAIGTQTSEGVFNGPGGVPIHHVANTYSEKHLKTRVVGLPFYPGNPNNLTTSQLAILGALGLSKLPG